MAILTRRNIGLAAGMAAAVALTAGALIAFSVRSAPPPAADVAAPESGPGDAGAMPGEDARPPA